MKKFIATALVATMTLGLCSCSNYSKAIVGEWTGKVYLEESDNLENLETLDFKDDEIEVIDVEGCAYIRCLTFNDDGTYELGVDDDLSEESFKEYYESVFETLYENRSSIDFYGGIFDSCSSVSEFTDSYASGYFGFSSGDEMIEAMAEAIYDQYTFDEEEGTYKATASQILFTAEGDDEALAANYTLDGDTLEVEFSDVTIEFEK